MTDVTTTKRFSVGTDRAGIIGSWPLSIALLALGFAQQAIGELNCDVSWFITFAERVLDGQTAYRDISDPNPPAAFLLYMPAVLVSRALGLRVEAATVVQLALFMAFCLWLSWRILRDASLMKPRETGVLRNAALYLFFIAPGYVFAEREHFAVLLALPIVAIYVVRGEGRAVRFSLALAAGLSAGAVLCFKPHFGLALGLPGLAMLIRRRSIAPLLSTETFVAIGVYVLYVASVRWLFPVYFEVTLPEVLAVYLLARHSALETASTPLTWAMLAIFAAASYGGWRVGWDRRALAVLLAGCGFALAYFIQGKLWSNHAAPAIELGALACCVLWVARRDEAPDFMEKFALRVLVPVLAVAPFLAVAQHDLLRAESYPGLTELVRRVGPAHPRIGALSEMMDVGHPLTRQVDGVWIGRQNALWRINMTDQILANASPDAAARARFGEIARRDRVELAEDVSRGKPDLVLVETAALRKRALATPELANMLDGYEMAGRASGVEVWTRVQAR
jgi:hypothetical protein